MTTKTASELTSTVADLQAKLDAAKTELEEALTARRENPLDYIGKLIYANRSTHGSYGYEYGDYGDDERRRAQQVLDAAGGDLNIAERFVTEFHIR